MSGEAAPPSERAHAEHEQTAALEAIAVPIARLLGIAPDEVGRALRILALIFVSSAALVLMKAAQSGVFLAAYPRTMIAWAFAASALTLATFSSLAVAAGARVGPVALASTTLATSAGSMLVLRVLLMGGAMWAGLGRVAPFLLYVVIEASAGLILIQTWSVVSETLDARSAKRLLPVAGMGASAAWTLLGLLVPKIVARIGTGGLLLLAPLLLLASLTLVRTIARVDLHGRVAKGRKSTGLLEGWKAGFSFTAKTPLMRFLVTLTVLALVTEQLMDFQMLAAARERHHDAAAIAAFFGTYYGVTSAISMVLLLGMSGRLLASLGATSGLSLTPMLTALVAAATVLVPGFGPIVVLRASDRILKSALWSSAMEQTQTPLPVLRRAQARALSRGVLAPLAYAVVGLVLGLLPATFDLRWMALATLLLCVASSAVIVLGVRTAYVRSLRAAIDDRRLRLDPGARDERHEGALAGVLDAEAIAALRAELQSDDEGRALLAVELLADARSPAAVDPLVAGLAHASAAVRAHAAEGLSRGSSPEAVAALRSALAHDPVASVRRAALEALVRVATPNDAATLDALALGESDTDRVVRARARVGAWIVRDPRAAASGESLELLVAEAHDDPALRDALLDAIERRALARPAFVELLRSLLRAESVEERLRGVEVVARLRARALIADVAPLLDDPRTAAPVVNALARWDEAALSALGEHAQPISTDGAAKASAASSSEGEREAASVSDVASSPVSRLLADGEHATRALGQLVAGGKRRPLPTSVVEPVLDRELRTAYRLCALLAGVARLATPAARISRTSVTEGAPARTSSGAFAAIASEAKKLRVTGGGNLDPIDVLDPLSDAEPSPGGSPLRWLMGELSLRVLAARTRVVQLLGLLESRRLAVVVEAGLRRPTPAQLAQIAELLEVALSRERARQIVPLFDRLPLRARLAAGARLGVEVDDALADPLACVVALGDPHLCGVVAMALGEDFAKRWPIEYESIAPMLPLFARMSFLRSVPLFRELPGDDLRLVAEIVEPVSFAAGTVIFRRGDPGDEMFLITSGKVDIRDNAKTIATLGSRELFGELAVLDREPRSADAICVDDAELLRLRGADLGELLARRPQIQSQIMLVLVRRLRGTAHREGG